MSLDLVIKYKAHNERITQIRDLAAEAVLLEEAAIQAERKFDHEKAEELRHDKRNAQSLIGMLVINSLKEQGEL
jgi:hypothetical protein